jgi:FMN reductase
VTDRPLALGIAGSLSSASRSTALVERTLAILSEAGYRTELVRLSELSAEALLGRARDAGVDRTIERVSQARMVVVGTPIYRASYTGQLKAFFDLLPRDALAHAVVGLIGTGAGRDHRLAIDHGLRPLVASLAGLSAARAIYASDAELDANTPELGDAVRALALELAELAPVVKLPEAS